MRETVDANLQHKGHEVWAVRPDDSVFTAVQAQPLGRAGWWSAVARSPLLTEFS